MEMQGSDLKTTKTGNMDSRRIIRTPSSFAREALLYVQELGNMTCTNAYQSMRDALDSYLIVFVKEGSGRIIVDGEKTVLRKGDVAFLDCRTAYSHHCDAKDPWQIAWVHFDGVVMPQIYEAFLQRNNSIVVAHVADRLESLYHQLVYAAEMDDPDYELLDSEALTRMITLLMTHKPEKITKASNIMSQKLEKVHQHLEKHFDEKISLEDLAEQCAISKFYLLREFKRKYGVTIVQFVNQCRINYAKEQLRFTDKAVEDIAVECGVSDSSYFNRIFRTTEGISAGKYRRQWRD